MPVSEKLSILINPRFNLEQECYTLQEIFKITHSYRYRLPTAAYFFKMRPFRTSEKEGINIGAVIEDDFGNNALFEDDI